MDADTAIGGPAGHFPETSHTCLERFRASDPLAREELAQAYWKPVYRYIRYKWRLSNEDAKDLTQGFFARALASGTFAAWDSEKAAFRTFVRLCADRHVLREREYAGRRKRFAGTSESFDEALHDSAWSPEEYFTREWMRQLFALSAADLRAHYAARGREVVYRAFELHDLAPSDRQPSYAEIAAHLNVAPTQVTNYLAAARRDLRRFVLARLRRLTANDREFRSEAKSLLGVDV